MFAPQLLKLINRLIDLTEKELSFVQEMKIMEASIVTAEKDPLITLYQNCIQKIKSDPKTHSILKTWEQFPLLKERIKFLDELNTEHERCIKRVERAQSRFVEMMQEKVLNTLQPVQNYNNRGYMVNRKNHYTKQGGGALATLDQSL